MARHCQNLALPEIPQPQVGGHVATSCRRSGGSIDGKMLSEKIAERLLGVYMQVGNLKSINWLNIILPSVMIAGMSVGGAIWWVHDDELARKSAEEYAERQQVQRMVLARMDKLRADEVPKYVEGMAKAGVDVLAIAAKAGKAVGTTTATANAAPTPVAVSQH